jgi:hypothetical protein
MTVKLKHEFEMILLEILERRGGCVGIPKLVVLLVLVLYFFLIISCHSSQTKKYFHLHYILMPTKWLVLQTNDIIVPTKLQTLVIIGKPFYSTS